LYVFDISETLFHPSPRHTDILSSPHISADSFKRKERKETEIQRRLNADKQHVLVVGPGLGRDDHMQSCARIAFELAKEMDQLGVVVDADGLWLVQVSSNLNGHAP
jgi:ATP-dependent NAD(P)H-hydrate dehydratase